LALVDVARSRVQPRGLLEHMLLRNHIEDTEAQMLALQL
jgi:hypothetical protein